jgi:lipopolysaccharide export system permease protein
MFVLLMLFLFKYIDDLIGKGFEWYVILELMLYASATNVAMALPLSILLSSIMTYGSLGENYELVAIKSAGISLRRAMYPMVIIVSALSVSAFIFSDYMLPIVNYKYYSLLWDVRKQKSAFLIKEGVFNNSFPGYSIRVKRKDPDGRTMHEIMIYQKKDNSNDMNVMFAKEGIFYRTANDAALVLKLKDGIRYEESNVSPNYDPRQSLTRFRFKETEQRFDLSSFKMTRTDESAFSSAFQMMNLKQLRYYRDSTQRQVDSSVRLNYRLLTPYIRYFNTPHKLVKGKKTVKAVSGNVLANLSKPDQLGALNNAANEARSIKELMKSRTETYKMTTKDIRKSMIEYQKKFTLSAACLALFLIGAPLGAIIRKGGLGLPVVVAVIFFLIYYIIATIGEKSVKEGSLSPVVGMWIAIAVLTPIGLFLSYKAANDSVLFDIEGYKRFFKRLFKRRRQAT